MLVVYIIILYIPFVLVGSATWGFVLCWVELWLQICLPSRGVMMGFVNFFEWVLDGNEAFEVAS